MTWIISSVVCSVVVSALLKLAPRWRVDVRQAIAGGYLVAALLALVLLHPHPDVLIRAHSAAAWRILIALGILLPSIFLVLARSVETAGVVRTDAAQRLSLVISLIAAFTFLGGHFTWLKGIGAALGLIAIALIVTRQKGLATGRQTGSWLWLAGVFWGLGVIDILFKRMAQLQALPFTDVLFATFVLAFVLSALYVGGLFATRRTRWSWRHLLAALLLGVFNFGNIYFYVEAHKHLAHNPALVFTAMNIGVIILATIVGMLAFRERPSRLNRIGLGVAIVAVAVLAFA